MIRTWTHHRNQLYTSPVADSSLACVLKNAVSFHVTYWIMIATLARTAPSYPCAMIWSHAKNLTSAYSSDKATKYLSLTCIIFKATSRISVRSSALYTALDAPWPSLHSTTRRSRIGNRLAEAPTKSSCLVRRTIPSAPTPACMPSTTRVPI